MSAGNTRRFYEGTGATRISDLGSDLLFRLSSSTDTRPLEYLL